MGNGLGNTPPNSRKRPVRPSAPDPDDAPALRIATIGTCTVYPPGQSDCLLYEHAADVDRARQRFGGRPLAPSAAASDLGVAA